MVPIHLKDNRFAGSCRKRQARGMQGDRPCRVAGALHFRIWCFRCLQLVQYAECQALSGIFNMVSMLHLAVSTTWDPFCRL